MKTFQGRVVTPGCAQAEALVSHGGLNTLASFQKSLQFGDKTAKCGDQNNPDLYGKPMAGKALCLPQTIGSTTGGLVLYCACAMDRQPACMLFANPIDSLAAAGAILADVWLQPGKMPVVDSLGEDFLAFVKARHVRHHRAGWPGHGGISPAEKQKRCSPGTGCTLFFIVRRPAALRGPGLGSRSPYGGYFPRNRGRCPSRRTI